MDYMIVNTILCIYAQLVKKYVRIELQECPYS